MQGLRNLAIGSFGRDQKFSQPAAKYEVLRLNSSEQGETKSSATSISENDLVSNFIEASQPSRRENASERPSFQLVRIVHADYSPLQIKNTNFIALFKIFKLDAYMLYLLSRNVYGFYQFEQSEDHEGAGADGVESYFLNTSLSTIMWAFHGATKKTKALLLTKDNRGKRNASERFQHFQEILRSFQDAFSSPRLLAIVACIEWIHFIHTTISKLIEDVRDVETKTGHGNWTTPGGINNVALDDISKCSRMIGKCLSTLSNQRRHLSIIESLCDFVHQDRQEERSENNPHSGEQKAPMSLSPAAAQLRTQIKWAKETVAYLTERAHAQSSVLLGLTSHHDATSNLQLAAVTLQLTQASVKLAEAAKQDSETTINLSASSLKLAEAAQRDSSAMKTIAVMTMVFLPATFFAALFAVPTLDWGSESVIGGRFWVYWAFTVPCTVGVFGLWMVLPYCEGLWGKVRARSGRGDGGLPTGRRDGK